MPKLKIVVIVLIVVKALVEVLVHLAKLPTTIGLEDGPGTGLRAVLRAHTTPGPSR